MSDGNAATTGVLAEPTRKRSNSATETPESPDPKRPKAVVPTANTSARNPTRDEKFYFEDGSCTILVDDTLFNVHKTVLARDNSFFAAMFNFPTGDNRHGMGRDDDSPVVLTGDTPSELRNFFWALYALPPELQLISSQDADLSRMVDIARISNKYSFRSLETWVLDVIHVYITRRPCPLISSIEPTEYAFSTAGPPDPSSSPGTYELTRLIRLAHMCNHEKVMTTMISIFKQLMSTSVDHAYLAMTLADELEIQDLRGPAYLEVMRKAPIVKASRADTLIKTKKNTAQEMANTTTSLVSHDPRPLDTDDDFPPGSLVVDQAQQLRLLSGFYRLSRLWEKLRANPPHFEHSAICSATWHQHGCTQSWLEFWKEKTKSEAMMGLGLADVIARIRQIQQEYNRWGSATYMHHDCRLAARKSLDEMAKSIEDALPDYFSGWD